MKAVPSRTRNFGVAALLLALGSSAALTSWVGLPVLETPAVEIPLLDAQPDRGGSVDSSGALLTPEDVMDPSETDETVHDRFDEAMTVAWAAVVSGAKFTLMYLVLVIAFHALKVHKRFGFFKVAEPASHFKTALLNWKVPFLWGVGVTLACYALGVDAESMQIGQTPRLRFELPAEYVFLHSPNLWTHVLWAILGFYLIDLTDWTAHWINHQYPSLYERFPFGHFVHHNMVYVNPFTIFSSPLIHFAQLTGLSMYVLLLSQGLWESVLMIHGVKLLSNATSHLGFDPLPWLTRLNHRVGGWIPWIPLHHQYHHIPGLYGNYGNITGLWDYVFGTVTPQCIPHIETGKPLPEIASLMANEQGQIDDFMKGKTRLSIG